jgi:foldase protein PrsA
MAGLAVILLLMGVLGYGYYATQIKPWHQVVLEVNDAKFDMEYYVKMLRFMTGGQKDTANLQQLTEITLNSIEDTELLRQGASRCSVSVTPDEITEKIKEIVSVGKPDDTGFEKRYQQHLKDIGLSDEEFHRAVESELLREKMREYLGQEISSLSVVPQVHVQGMLLESEEKAREMITELDSGKDFAELARDSSLDKAAAEKGGDLGWFPKGLYPELDEIAFNLEIGELSQPIPTGNGYHLIIKVLEKEDSRELDDSQREALKNKALLDWFSEERENSKIERHFSSKEYSWAINHL